jgi:predicted DNA-binding transcriptional regulator AlpA
MNGVWGRSWVEVRTGWGYSRDMQESYGISEGERFSVKELADMLGTDLKCLYRWRREKRGPPYIRLVGRIYYPKGAFEEWLKQQMHNV